jgi:hypothetical protein
MYIGLSEKKFELRAEDITYRTYIDIILLPVSLCVYIIAQLQLGHGRVLGQ